MKQIKFHCVVFNPFIKQNTNLHITEKYKMLRNINKSGYLQCVMKSNADYSDYHQIIFIGKFNETYIKEKF